LRSGVLTILVVLILPLPPLLLDFALRHLDHLLGADPDDVAVHQHAARVLRLPDRGC